MTDPKDEGDELMKGPSLSADGRIDRIEAPVEFNSRPMMSRESLDLELELAPTSPPVIEPRIEQFRDVPPPPSERRRSGALLFIGVLLTLAIAAVVALLYFQPKLPETPVGVSEPTIVDRLNMGERQPIIVSSTPTGAKVLIAGQLVGETPWAGDNRWSENTPIRIEAAGFKPWSGTIEANKPVVLDVTLKR